MADAQGRRVLGVTGFLWVLKGIEDRTLLPQLGDSPACYTEACKGLSPFRCRNGARGSGRVRCRASHVLSLGRTLAWITVLVVLSDGELVSSATAQEVGQSPGRMSQLQGGPFAAVTTTGGGTWEYGLYLGSRSGKWRPDGIVSVNRVDPPTVCNPSSAACRTMTHWTALLGLSRALVPHADSPTLGFRVGVANDGSLYGPSSWWVFGPHVSIGHPITPFLGIRGEAGALQYARSGSVGGRVYGSVGVQLRF